jgi:Zn finger protein HypA/HybF involved in hydrogenase expression
MEATQLTVQCQSCGSSWIIDETVEDAVITHELGVTIVQTACNLCGSQMAEFSDNRKSSPENR